MKKNTKLGIVVIFLIFLFPIHSNAQNYVWHSGVVKGTLKGFSKLGQYCEASADCTAAKYKHTAYNRYQPLREMKVRVYINNRIAGQGTTNTVGNYQISWDMPLTPRLTSFRRTSYVYKSASNIRKGDFKSGTLMELLIIFMALQLIFRPPTNRTRKI